MEYHQNQFLPAMKGHEEQFVCYVAGDVEKKLISPQANYVECWLVLCMPDGVTTQANGVTAKSWALQDQYALQKKRVGCGLPQSGVICLTVRWLAEGYQVIEYGKNYDGYSTGEPFMKQALSKNWLHLSCFSSSNLQLYSNDVYWKAEWSTQSIVSNGLGTDLQNLDVEEYSINDINNIWNRFHLTLISENPYLFPP